MRCSRTSTTSSPPRDAQRGRHGDCQTEVAADDPAFARPSKPIGSFMDAETAGRRRQEGWALVEDSKPWLAPSRGPLRSRSASSRWAIIRRLVEGGTTVVTAGGGGIPVVADADGLLTGVAAVIDKDLVSALLATELGADCSSSRLQWRKWLSISAPAERHV